MNRPGACGSRVGHGVAGGDRRAEVDRTQVAVAVEAPGVTVTIEVVSGAGQQRHRTALGAKPVSQRAGDVGRSSTGREEDR